ncbi:MAG: ComEA family DNA-binding protein [Planctomycetota bacterium]
MRNAPARNPSLALALVLACWGAVETACALVEAAAAERRSRRFAPLKAATIDLNSSPPHRLRLLPGIGPVRAAAIVETRSRDGPFRRLEELRRVPGIGPHTVEGLRRSGADLRVGGRLRAGGAAVRSSAETRPRPPPPGSGAADR